MRHNIYCKGSLILLLGLAGCSTGKWVHPIHGDAQTLQDWDTCKAEVLGGAEYQKEALAAAHI